MPMRSGRPSSIDGIKRLAKVLTRERSLQHARALDEASQAAGYANFAHARRALSDNRAQGRGAPANDREKQHMNVEDFHSRARAAWVAAIRNAAGPNVPSSGTYRGPGTITRILTHIMGSNSNHTHLPGGGGLDMHRIRPSKNEPGCLEFFPFDSDDVVYLMKPKRLTLEYIEESPGESFFYLELDELEPTGVYTKSEDEEADGEHGPLAPHYEQFSEEVVEVGPRQYVSRSGWDDGEYPDGRELPKTARLVVRHFRGAAMAVSKGSIWNGAAETYDGRHSRMTPEQIRRVIERTIAHSKA